MEVDAEMLRFDAKIIKLQISGKPEANGKC